MAKPVQKMHTEEMLTASYITGHQVLESTRMLYCAKNVMCIYAQIDAMKYYTHAGMYRVRNKSFGETYQRLE